MFKEELEKFILNIAGQHCQSGDYQAGKWYPNSISKASCCESIRSPTNNWPSSFWRHCQTTKHVKQWLKENITFLEERYLYPDKTWEYLYEEEAVEKIIEKLKI